LLKYEPKLKIQLKTLALEPINRGFHPHFQGLAFSIQVSETDLEPADFRSSRCKEHPFTKQQGSNLADFKSSNCKEYPAIKQKGSNLTSFRTDSKSDCKEHPAIKSKGSNLARFRNYNHLQNSGA